MTGRPKVLITNPFIPQKGLDVLKEKCDLILCDGENPSKEEILKKVKNVDAIFWSSTYTVDKLLVDTAGPNLKVVSNFGVGYDNLDVNLLKSRGIKVGNTANVLNDSVAEVALALTLTAAHRIQEGRTMIESGKWVKGNPSWLLGKQLSGSTVGVVGLGRIGQEIIRRVKAFKVEKLLYTGHSEKSEGKQLGAEFISLDGLVHQADFIIISCPLTPETKHLFNKELFNKMKPDAIVINISRGEVIKQDDLIEVLTNKKIGGAALDVTTPEPLPHDHPLIKLENCVLSPHLGSATHQTRNEMAVLAAKNILAALEGKPMPSPV